MKKRWSEIRVHESKQRLMKHIDAVFKMSDDEIEQQLKATCPGLKFDGERFEKQAVLLKHYTDTIFHTSYYL